MVREPREHAQDFFTIVGRTIEHFLIHNLKWIIIGVSVVVVGFAAYFTVDHFISKKEEAANDVFGKVYLSYTELIDKKDQMADQKFTQDLSELNKKFKQVLEKYPETRAGIRSAYFLGSNLYTIDRFEEAAKYFNKGYRANTRFHLALRCLEAEANCYEQLGNVQKAMEIYQKIEKEYPDSYIIPFVEFNLAQLYEHNNKPSEAKQNYHSITSNYEWSSWSELSEKRLLLLGEVENDQKP